MRRYRRGNGPSGRRRNDGVHIPDFNPAESSDRSCRHPPTGAGHPARDSAGQRRASTGHRRAVTRHGAVHRYRSRGQHHGTRPDLLAVPESHHCQQQERDVTRMKPSTYHTLTILTLRELNRNRREARAFRAVEYRDSRCEGNEVPPHGYIRLVPRIEVLTMRRYRGVSLVSPPRFADTRNGIPGIADLLRQATAAGPYLP